MEAVAEDGVGPRPDLRTVSHGTVNPRGSQGADRAWREDEHGQSTRLVRLLSQPEDSRQRRWLWESTTGDRGGESLRLALLTTVFQRAVFSGLFPF